MKMFDKLNELDKKQQYTFFIALLSAAAVLSFPLMLLKETYDIHLYIIFTTLTSFLVGFKSCGLLKELSEKQNDIAAAVVFAAAPILIAAVSAKTLSTGYIYKNCIIVLIPYLILFFIFRTSSVCISVVSVFCTILYIINDVLMTVRGTALNLFDFLAFKTAFTVSSNYKYEITEKVYYSVLCTAFLITASVIFPMKLKALKANSVRKYTLVFSVTVFTASSIWLAMEFAGYDTVYDFQNQDTLNERGVCYNLTLSLKDRFYKAPDGYTTEAAEKILDRYQGDDALSENPNIIIVMNESFADLSSVENMIPMEEYMPFYCSLEKNAAKGKAVVSCFGGGTSNSEFEFLTGLTMTFLPRNSYPYLQYINGDINTLFQELDPDVYEKSYIHPYIGSNYKRSSIFGFLGFDAFYDGLSFSTQDTYTKKYTARNAFLEYEGVDMVRGFIGDGVTYDKVMELYENKAENRRSAQFIVTMQNHSPYTYEGGDFINDVRSGTDDPAVDQYLSLIKLSDSELERLINYFSEAEEDTIVVFFGDHQPFLSVYPTTEELMGQPYEKALQMYSTPFLIWTNYDSETRDLGYVSLNYLSALMKEQTGLPLTDFDKFRLEMYEKYPVFSINIAQNSSGDLYGGGELINDEIINEYEYLQYYYLFDN